MSEKLFGELVRLVFFGFAAFGVCLAAAFPSPAQWACAVFLHLLALNAIVNGRRA